MPYDKQAPAGDIPPVFCWEASWLPRPVGVKQVPHCQQKSILNDTVIYETLLSIKRAGARTMISYHAKDIARQMQEGTLEL